MIDPRRAIAVCFWASLLLITLLVLLFARHARAQEQDYDPCAQELMLRWNEFARNSNQHIQVVDVNREHHEKVHRKLEHEWEALHALSCW